MVTLSIKQVCFFLESFLIVQFVQTVSTDDHDMTVHVQFLLIIRFMSYGSPHAVFCLRVLSGSL